MEKIPFKVSARAGKLLGRENFSNASGAVLELVKNSYDADGSVCLVLFDIPKSEKAKATIYIIDDGEGMTREVIEEHWMTIGTGNKEDVDVSINKRVKTGAKGIGRFALDRLGHSTEMLTYSKKAKSGLSWGMNWDQFDQADKVISDIEADIDVCQLGFVENIRKIDVNYGVNLSSKINKTSGTILKIEILKDNWNEAEIDQIFKDLEALIPPKDLNIDFDVFFFHTQKKKNYGKVSTAYFDDYDYKLISHYDAESKKVSIECHRNELDIKTLEKKYGALFNCKRMSDPYNLATLKRGVFNKKISIWELLEIEPSEQTTMLLENLGSFSFNFYFLKLQNSSKEGYPYKMITPSSRKALMKRFGGIKIYRDSFRVRPYGDPSNDWLNLDGRAARSPAGPGQRIGDWRVRAESAAGIISISRNSNDKLVDKSDRGSLVENETFELFRNIIVGIIHQFERDRTLILNPIYELHKKQKAKKAEEEIERKAEELAEVMIAVSASGKDHESIKNSVKSQATDALREGVGNSDYSSRNEVMEIRTLASLGLIVSSFAHEIKEIRNDSHDIKDLEKLYKSIGQDTGLNEVEYHQGLDIIKLLKRNSTKIQHWVDFALTSIPEDKRKRKAFNVEDFFALFHKRWETIFEAHQISFSIKGDSELSERFRAFPMDMDTVFSNLVNNSIDSFQRLKKKRKRAIKIEYRFSEKYLEITYEDTGQGLTESFSTPEDIFLPFTTTKKDKKGSAIGYGLGMYLVKSVIDDYSGKIQILGGEVGFALLIRLPLRKQ